MIDGDALGLARLDLVLGAHEDGLRRRAARRELGRRLVDGDGQVLAAARRGRELDEERVLVVDEQLSDQRGRASWTDLLMDQQILLCRHRARAVPPQELVSWEDLLDWAVS